MPASKSDRPRLYCRRIGRDDEAVSEVVGFLLTFAIIATVLVVAMLGFSDAQSRAERRVADIQADSIAQRVAGVMVEAALFLERQDCSGSTLLSLGLELPAELQGHGYIVRLEDSPPRVTVASSITNTKTQSLFSAVNDDTCSLADPRPMLCVAAMGNVPFAASGGNLYVKFNPSAPVCLGISNSPVT